MSRVPSLRSRIRNGTLILVVLVVAAGLYALPHVYRLGGTIRETLHRSYLGIEAAEHMHAALRTLEETQLEIPGPDVLPAARREFTHWMDVENQNFTEPGQAELAHDIQSGAIKLFDEIAQAGGPSARYDREFEELHRRLDDLIEMNRAAMLRADSRAIALGKRLTYEFVGGLVVLAVAGAALSWGLGWALSKPLTDLAERLRGISQRKTQVRLGPQRLAELETVAREFNQMAEELERYEKVNLERLLYEKSKIEAIIESLEDGVVLIDREGIVTHINEVAAIIMSVERKEALGSPIDDLSSNHPHYLRIRDALRALRRSGQPEQRLEVQLHVRGRDHSYVLKPVPLVAGEGPSFGTLLILQDVTYLRDQDRARINLVATLSHELRTPLTSIALSADLLSRQEPELTDRQRQLVGAILEECARMRQLCDNLLNLARGEVASIALNREPLDLSQIATEAVARFTLQAQEKQVRLEGRIGDVPQIKGDPIKLSWVVSNLVGNALRYTPVGGQIEVCTLQRNGTARLEVADSGPGIPSGIRDHIFERFAQYGAGDDERGAAGLGLAIAKEIVEAHGGRIFVESNGDTGSRFIVELPLAKA